MMMMIAKEDRRERKGKKVHKKRCQVQTQEKHENTLRVLSAKRERKEREKKVKPKNFQKTP